MQSFRYYGLAFIIIVIAELVTTGLQLLGSSFPTDHPVAMLVGNLSGITLGGILMVIGFLKDNRLDQERKRADAAEARAEQERERADVAEARIQQERERADRLLAELLETRKTQDAMEARVRRLEERLDGDHPEADHGA